MHKIFITFRVRNCFFYDMQNVVLTPDMPNTFAQKHFLKDYMSTINTSCMEAITDEV